MRDPILAGFLSLLIPGVGQIYNGRVLIGIIWLVVTGVSEATSTKKLAFAVGNQLVFGGDAYAPGTAAGRR